MARSRTGGTPATVALTQAGIAHTLHPYAHEDGTSSYGEEAAAALGVSERTVRSDWGLARAWLYKELKRGGGA